MSESGEEFAMDVPPQEGQEDDAFFCDQNGALPHDVRGDGSLLKSILRRGEGWSRPKAGASVRVHYRRLGEEGAVLEDSREQWRNGCGFDLDAGPEAPVFADAVKTMTRHELARVEAKGEGEGDGGVFEVELLEWQDDQDISPDEQEGMVMLRQTTKGPGFTAPQELDTVTIRFRVRTATNPDQSPWEQTTAVVDELNVCRGLEVGVMAMTPGSVGTLTVHPAYAFGDQGSEKYHVAPGEMVHIDLEVLRLEERPKPYNLPAAERIKHAQQLKAWGNEKFRTQDYERALRRYEHAARYVEYDDDVPSEEKCPILLNLSATHLSLGDHVSASDYANRVLRIQSDNAKAYYRRALAHEAALRYEDAEADLKHALELQPNDAAVMKRLQQLYAKLRAHKEHMKASYANMFQKLGGFASEDRSGR